MITSPADLEVATELRQWAEARSPARKRARSVAACFGRTNLTRQTRTRIQQALLAAGVEPRPSMATCGRDDWLQLVVVGESTVSYALPTQMVAYHSFNWTGEGNGGPIGEWLPCLSSTRLNDRQFIWSNASIAGVVTFAGWIRHGKGFYRGWGSISTLSQPINRAALLADDRTASRFDSRGIKALEGLPIKVSPELAGALSEMAGGLAATEVPLDEPTDDAELPIWTGLHGLRPEAYIEAAVATQPRLWRQLKFPRAPTRQRILETAGRVDLIAGDVVGEAKRAVTLNDGPCQIERYLNYLEVTKRRPRSKLRGILLQASIHTSQAVIDRLAASRYKLELWSVVEDRHWQLDRLA
jgi:hypothetical protein